MSVTVTVTMTVVFLCTVIDDVINTLSILITDERDREHEFDRCSSSQ
jgi:hypothetical protein